MYPLAAASASASPAVDVIELSTELIARSTRAAHI
jgi:hypothetical protein